MKRNWSHMCHKKPITSTIISFSDLLACNIKLIYPRQSYQCIFYLLNNWNGIGSCGLFFGWEVLDLQSQVSMFSPQASQIKGVSVHSSLSEDILLRTVGTCSVFKRNYIYSLNTSLFDLIFSKSKIPTNRNL